MQNILDIIFYLFLFISTVIADDPVSSASNIIGNEYTPSVMVSGILTILIGTLMLFFGYRSLKFLLFFAGFFVFSIIGFAILTKTNAGEGNPNVLLWGSVAIGILGGLLAIFIYRLGVALLGALGGMALAGWILSLKAGGLLTDDTQRIIFVVVFALVGAIAIHFAEKPIIILCSSFSGAYSICYGIDTFTRLGYAGRLRETYNTGIERTNFEAQAQEIGWQLGLLLAANIALFIIGVWYQFRSNRDRDHMKGF